MNLKLTHVLLLGICAGLQITPAVAAGKGKGPGGGGGGTGTATYSGHAVALDASVLGIRTVLSEAGPLPSQGGAAEASLLAVNVAGLAQAGVLHSAAVAKGGHSRSEASVASLGLTVLNAVSINAGFIQSRAGATCSSTVGASALVDLVINGQAIRVSGKPNQQINLLLAKVIINEQIAGDGEIIVNALHVIVLDILGKALADVVVASSHADITCQGTPPGEGGDDFITGGGWITTPSGAKGNFGVAGGIKNGSLWGHLTYIDHGTGLKVKHNSITGYTVVNSTTRLIAGTADANGQTVNFTVVVADNGEPGSSDTFHIQLSNGYSASGTLGGGNIQLHNH